MALLDDYRRHDAVGLAKLVREGVVTPEALLDHALKTAEALNPGLNAIVSMNVDYARSQIVSAPKDAPLYGVPFLLKDIGAETPAFPATDGSALMRGLPDTVTSTLFVRLEAAGLVTFGRTAVPENAIGVATEARANGGPTRNPWSLEHTPGGSSGGAAAAVAAGIVPAAHGSDGGGSIRVPASCTGLFGFKPTRGRMPDGPISGESWAGMASDGFLTRSVRDTAALLDATAGPDLGAPYTAPDMPGSFTSALTAPVAPLRIAFTDTTFDGRAIHADCSAAVHEAAALLEGLGHSVFPARPATPDHQDMMSAWTDIVACGTALTVRAALAEHGRTLLDDDVEPLTRGALQHAATLSGADYLSAVNRIHRYGRDMAQWFEDTCDVLLCPTLAEPPAKIGRFDHSNPDYVDYRTGPGGVFAYSPFAAAFNATGQPAMSVPLAWSSEDLPIGLHFAGRFGQDHVLMALAAQLEAARPWFTRVPDLKDTSC